MITDYMYACLTCMYKQYKRFKRYRMCTCPGSYGYATHAPTSDMHGLRTDWAEGEVLPNWSRSAAWLGLQKMTEGLFHIH